jgi:RND superfamily putative drug exporter
VLVSLSAVMLVPSPAFRSTSLGIMLAVLFVLAATLTLLPAVLAKLGPRIDRCRCPGCARRASLAAPRCAGPSCSGGGRCLFGGSPWRLLVALALPVLSAEDRDAVDQGRPASDRRPAGLRAAGQRPSAPGAPARCRSSSRSARPHRLRRGVAARRPAASRACSPPQPGGRQVAQALIQADPDLRSLEPRLDATIDRLRADAADPAR